MSRFRQVSMINVYGFENQPRNPPCTTALEDQPSGCKWLITMVSMSPKDRVVGVPLPNSLFMAYKYGLLATGMALQEFTKSCMEQNHLCLKPLFVPDQLLWNTFFPNQNMGTRWAPTSYKWGYSPYEWVTGVISLLKGVISTFITGRGSGPACKSFHGDLKIHMCVLPRPRELWSHEVMLFYPSRDRPESPRKKVEMGI